MTFLNWLQKEHQTLDYLRAKIDNTEIVYEDGVGIEIQTDSDSTFTAFNDMNDMNTFQSIIAGISKLIAKLISTQV